MTEIYPQSSQPTHRLLIILGIIVVLVGIFYLASSQQLVGFVYQQIQTVLFGKSNNQAVTTALQGDIILASTQAQQALKSNTTSSAYDTYWNQGIVSYAKATTATTSSSNLAAAHDVLSAYQAASGNFYRAWSLDNIIVFEYYRGSSKTSALFSTESTLAPYIVASDPSKTVTNLAQFSYQMYPTSEAAYFAAVSDEVYIKDNFSKASDPKTASALKTAKNNILSWLAKGDHLRTIEERYASSSPMGVAYASWSDLYRTTRIASIALVDSSYWSQSHIAFQSVLNDYETTRDAQGKQYPFLLQPVAIASLSEASYLYMYDAKHNEATIKSDLDEFVQAVQANPSAEQSIVSSINGALAGKPGADMSAYSTSTVAFLQEGYQRYLSYAKISPSFKAFLITQGWNIPQ